MINTLCNVCTLLLVSFLNVVFGDIIVYSIQEHAPYNVIKDMPSTFGAAIPLEGFEAMVAIANPPDACEAIDPPSAVHNYRGKWVALIARHNCTYERKVRMAQSSQYNGVIVYNIDSDNLIAMTAANSTGIHIPSVFIGAYDANYLKELSDTKQFYVIITPDAPFNINTHLLLPFAIVVGILFIVMVIFMARIVVKCIIAKCALDKILIHKFVRGDPYEKCMICLEDYIEGEELSVLPCAHAYHSKCIDPWLFNHHRVCPMCRRRVVLEDGGSSESSSDSDTDDTSPLLNGMLRSELSESRFTRIIQVIRSNFPSINGDSDESSDSSSYLSALEANTIQRPERSSESDVVKCIKDRRRAMRNRLPASALNKMLIHKFVKGDPYETCAICLDDYIEGEKLRVLPCAHAYHSKCIDPWLTNNRRVCPICKRKVFAQNEEPCSSDSDSDDDTTPLMNASNQNQPTGGTFTVSNETELARREFARLLGYIRAQQIMLGSNYSSINGDSSAESSHSDSDLFPPRQGGAVETVGIVEEPQRCPDTNVHVHTRPESANSSDSDVVI